MPYAEHQPSPRIARWVHCVWTFDSARADAMPERIVPDGRPELVVHLARPYSEAAADGSFRVQPRALFAGQLTRPLLLRAAGAASVVGVRFKPAGARAFLGLPMRESVDTRIALDGLWAGRGTALANAMAASTRCVAMIEAIVGKVALDVLLQAAGVFDLIEHDGERPWTDAGLGAGYYDQSHFIREFRRFVGCTPGEFFRTGAGLATALVEP